MKILAICGSPRKGNSEFLARKFIEAAAAKGAEAELVLLREKNIAECTGCDGCYGTQMECTIDDDMAEIMLKMMDADLIVFSTPIYFDNVTGIMKIFMDRTDPICSPPKLKGKKAFVICVGDLPVGDSSKRCEENLKNFISIHEMEHVGSFLATADQPNEISQKPKLIKKLQDIAERIVK